jgi:hypothetical protein
MDPLRHVLPHRESECAASYLLQHGFRVDAHGTRRPDGLIDRTLLAHPESFGGALARPLVQARECVLRDGDAGSRDLLAARPSSRQDDADIARARRILAGRPGADERASPALVAWQGGLHVVLAHPVPHATLSLALRIQIDAHPDCVHAVARRTRASEALCERWRALGHADGPHSAWCCSVPTWMHGSRDIVVEIVPNPTGFNEAMLIAHYGAGRVLVPHDDSSIGGLGHRSMRACVMPSGWSYLHGDRTMGSSDPLLPNGAPHPSTGIRIPDDDLFALCASLTWTVSLRDALWLRRRADYRMLG